MAKLDRDSGFESKAIGFFAELIGVSAVMFGLGSLRAASPVVCWGVVAAGIAAAAAGRPLRKGRAAVPPALARFLFTSEVILITVFFTIAADRLLGAAVLKGKKELIFRAGSSATYHTREFSYKAEINNLGFRDRDYAPGRRAGFRVLTIGDSFTFGWGNRLEDVWSKVLERRLRSDGADVEIMNLGQGGQFPDSYAAIAEKAVPALKPDLIIVAVLQGDDLYQTLQAAEGAAARKSFKQRIAPVLSLMYPNLVMLARLRRPDSIDINTNWRETAAAMSKNFSPEQRARFSRIDPEVKEMFAAGDLNPGLVDLAVKSPRLFLEMENLKSPRVAKGVARMARDFSEIKSLGARFHARTIIVSVPYRAYVCKPGLQQLARIGFDTDAALLSSRAADEAIRAAARAAGLEFHTVTAAFRTACDAEPNLYYPFDGHFTPAGNRLFADTVYPMIKRDIKR